jgi:hypothetical protein
MAQKICTPKGAGGGVEFRKMYTYHNLNMTKILEYIILLNDNFCMQNLLTIYTFIIIKFMLDGMFFLPLIEHGVRAV